MQASYSKRISFLQLGSVLSFYLSGLLLSHWQWPVVFYFWSTVAIVWFIIFVSVQVSGRKCRNRKRQWHWPSGFQTLLCYSDPASHPFISLEERNYLKAELGQIKRHEDLPTTPWKSVFTSVPVLALIFGQVNPNHPKEFTNSEFCIANTFRSHMIGSFMLWLPICQSIWPTCWVFRCTMLDFIHLFHTCWCGAYQSRVVFYLTT